MDSIVLETHEGQEAERFDSGNLSIIELKLIGSTSTTASGEPIDTDHLINQALQGNEEARHKLMTPVNLLNGKKDLDTVKVERESAKIPNGAFFLDKDQQIKFSEEGKNFTLQLSKLNSTAEIDRELKLRIDDPNLSPSTISQHIKDLSSLRLNPDCGSWLTLGEVAGETAPDGSFRPYRQVTIDFKEKT